jgi:hypothetical protein
MVFENRIGQSMLAGLIGAMIFASCGNSKNDGEGGDGSQNQDTPIECAVQAVGTERIAAASGDCTGLTGQPVCDSNGVAFGKSAGIAKGQALNDPSVNFCGGGASASDAEAQRSCTPFMYKPYVSDYSGFGPVSQARWDQATGYTSNPSRDHRVWASYGPGSKRNSDDYWVFHSGDGAGIEDDCLGDIFYIERIGRMAGVASKDQERTLSNGWCDSSKNNRTQSPVCHFVHPGTQNYYDDYYSGWACEAGANCGPLNANAFQSGGGDNVRRWNPQIQAKVLNLMNDANLNPWKGDPKNMQFMLFPWVCAYDANKNGNNFSYPTLTESSQYKCYADNEALGGWPPLIEIYSMLPTTDSSGKEILQGVKWVYDLQTGPDLEPRLVTEDGFTLYPCTDGECEY